VLPHRLDQVDRPGDIVRVVQHRLCHGLPDGLAPGEVDDGIKLFRPQGGVDGRGVAQVALDERHLGGLLGARELLHALEALKEGVVEVVEDGDGVARVEEGEDGVRAWFFFEREEALRLKGGLRESGLSFGWPGFELQMDSKLRAAIDVFWNFRNRFSMLGGALWHGTRSHRPFQEAEEEREERKRDGRETKRKIDWARAFFCLFHLSLLSLSAPAFCHPNLRSPMYPIPPVTKTLGMAGLSWGRRRRRRRRRSETGTTQMGERKKKR